MKKKLDPLTTPIWSSTWDEPVIVMQYKDEFMLPGEAFFIDGLAEYVEHERAKKFRLLFERYELSEQQGDSWKLLAVELAKELYDGFKVLNPKTNRNIQYAGKSVTWTSYHLGMLWCDVAILKHEQQGTTKDALRIICKRSPWDKMLGMNRIDGESLEGKVRVLNKHYLAAKKTELVNSIDAYISSFELALKTAKLLEIRARLSEHVEYMKNLQKYPSYLERTTR